MPQKEWASLKAEQGRSDLLEGTPFRGWTQSHHYGAGMTRGNQFSLHRLRSAAKAW